MQWVARLLIPQFNLLILDREGPRRARGSSVRDGRENGEAGVPFVLLADDYQCSNERCINFAGGREGHEDAVQPPTQVLLRGCV